MACQFTWVLALNPCLSALGSIDIAGCLCLAGSQTQQTAPQAIWEISDGIVSPKSFKEQQCFRAVGE